MSFSKAAAVLVACVSSLEATPNTDVCVGGICKDVQDEMDSNAQPSLGLFQKQIATDARIERVEAAAAAKASDVCSVTDGTTLSASYPCACGTASCFPGEVCTSSTNTCKAVGNKCTTTFAGTLVHHGENTEKFPGRTAVKVTDNLFVFYREDHGGIYMAGVNNMGQNTESRYIDEQKGKNLMSMYGGVDDQLVRENWDRKIDGQRIAETVKGYWSDTAEDITCKTPCSTKFDCLEKTQPYCTNGYCSKEACYTAGTYEPYDKDLTATGSYNARSSSAGTAAECQSTCASVTGCAHFSWSGRKADGSESYGDVTTCFLSNSSASWKNRPDAFTGPPSCSDN